MLCAYHGAFPKIRKVQNHYKEYNNWALAQSCWSQGDIIFDLSSLTPHPKDINLFKITFQDKIYGTITKYLFGSSFDFSYIHIYIIHSIKQHRI